MFLYYFYTNKRQVKYNSCLGVGIGNAGNNCQCRVSQAIKKRQHGAMLKKKSEIEEKMIKSGWKRQKRERERRTG